MNASIVLILLKASVLLAAALAAARLMTRATAGRRHLLWSGAFAALVLLPLLAMVLPPIEVTLRPRDVETPAVSAPAAGAEAPVAGEVTTTTTTFSMPASAAVPSFQLPPARSILIGTWVFGFGVAVIALLVSFARVSLLARRGRLVLDAGWWQAATDIASRLGVTTPIRLIAAPGVTTPMASGIVRPTVFVPADAATWSAERRDVVLAHEIAHIASRDPLRHLLARAAMTFYWFHPLAWLAARNANTACEQACDEAVLSLGFRPSTYAQVLLDFADGAPRTAPVAALPIVRRHLLETRLMAILDETPRRAAGRRAILPVALGVGLTLSVAALRPSEAPMATAAPASAPTLTSHDPVAAEAPVTKAPVTKTRGTEPAATKAPVVIPTVTAGEAVDCERGGWNGEFSGSSTNSHNGVIDRIVQRRFSDLRVCMAGERMPKGDLRPSEWSGQAERLVFETEERSGDVRRMEINRGITTYSINGRPVAIDAEAQEWRRALVGVLDAVWEVNQLHGRVNSLRGEINSIQGNRNSLLGEINSLQGQVNSMQGEINSARGQENSLRGEINSINGELNSMRGQINSEQGAINSLNGSRNDRYADQAAIDARIRRHEDNIRRIEDDIARYDAPRRIRAVERRIADYDADGRVAEIQRRIRDFDLEGKIAAVQRRIAQLDVEGQVSSIETEISGLHEGDRTRELEERTDAALRALRARLRR